MGGSGVAYEAVSTLASMASTIAPVMLQAAVNQFTSVGGATQAEAGATEATGGNAAQGVKIAMYGNLNEISQATSCQIPLLAEGSMHSPMYPPSRHRLVDIAKTPGIVRQVTFSNTGDKTVIPLRFGPWGDYIAEHFRAIRGTVRVGLHFFTHPLLAGRFVIQMNTNDQVSTNDATRSDIPSLTVLVKGSDSKMIDCPYHHDTFVRETVPSGTIMNNLTVEMTAAPTEFATGVDTQIFLVVTMSAGDDVQFFSVRNTPGVDLAAAAPAVAKTMTKVVIGHSIRKLHANKAEICMGEITTPKIPYLPEIDTVEQLAQRWSERVTRENLNAFRYQVPPIPHELTEAQKLDGGQMMYGCKYDVMAAMFYMTRSSLDFRIVLQETPGLTEAWAAMADGLSTSSVGVRGAQDPSNGITLTRTNQQPVLEYRAPFLSLENGSVDQKTTFITAVNGNASLFATSPHEQRVYARATEDLRFSFLNILPEVVSKPLV